MALIINLTHNIKTYHYSSVHAVVEVKVVNEVAAKVAEESNKQLTFEEEWRQRLIKEGKLKVDTGPQGGF